MATSACYQRALTLRCSPRQMRQSLFHLVHRQQRIAAKSVPKSVPGLKYKAPALVNSSPSAALPEQSTG
jgi:hypothetical protein